MPVIELGDDDLLDGGKYVKLSVVASAIAKELLANGSPNRFQAERDAWPFIHTGIVSNKLHPLDQTNLQPLSPDNSGDGMVLFDELVEWGQWCKRFDFVKQAALASSGTYEPLCPLLADYWDKPRSELPENLQARVSGREVPGHYEHREKLDVNGELECNSQGHYPVWEEVYIKRFVREWLVDWDSLTPEQRKACAMNIDCQHAKATRKYDKFYTEISLGKEAVEAETIEANTEPDNTLIGYYGIKKEWDFWASKPTLTADEAVPLMNGCDPTTWRNRANRSHYQALPDYWVAAIERGLVIAESEGIKANSPAGWIEWGKKHGLDQPISKSEPGVSMWPLFADAVSKHIKAKKAETTSESGDAAAKVEDEKQADTANDSDHWTAKARAIADECFDHDTNMNCRDSLKGYSVRVMDIMQKRGIKGPRGIFDNPNTIMREALQGEKWWTNKSK